MILIEVNGEKREIPAGLHVRGLLDFLKVDAGRVAVELNREIVRKTDWEGTAVEAGATVEVVMFVGGGREGAAGIRPGLPSFNVPWPDDMGDCDRIDNH